MKKIFEPSSEQKGIKVKSILINSAIMAGLMCLMLFSSAFIGIEDTLNSDSFAQGMQINDVDVSNMSLENAKKALIDAENEKLNSIKFNLSYNNKDLLLDKNTLGITTNIENIINEAYSKNKGENLSLNEIFDKWSEIQSGATINSTLDIDKQILYNNVNDFISKNSIQSQDAIAKFNKSTHAFTYKDAVNGTVYDANKAVEKIMENIAAKDFSDIQIFGEVVYPTMTLKDAKKNTELISTYETEANDNENRNTNIQLMIDAINGLKIDSGQTLSINELVGERTAEKGFKMAPAIAWDNDIKDEIGGGICQVSGTLYNAALLANMDIVERVHHSIPSDYLPLGLDATLNWDDKDLKIKNSSEYPIYIGASFEDNKVKIDIYGQPLPKDVKIEIVNDIQKTTDPGSATIISTPSLTPGVTKVKTPKQVGHDVEVTRNYYVSDELINSEIISKDHFEAVKAVILKGENIDK